MNRIAKTGLAALAGSLMMLGAQAGNPDRVGQAGATQLLINPWARSSGWGGMYMAGVRGVESMSLNVAGLVNNPYSTELAFAHSRWLTGSGISINAFGLAQKLGAEGTNALGLSITSFDFGDIKATHENQPEESGATFNITMMNIALGYSHRFSDNISAGVLVRAVSEGIPDVSAQGVALDAGIQYTAGEKDRVKFGVALRNVGPTMKFEGNGLSSRGVLEGYENQLTLHRRSSDFEMPSVLNIGASYDLFSDSTNSHTFTLAGAFTSNAFSNDQVGLGLQYSMRNFLVLRAGYVYEAGMYSEDNSTTTFSGPSAGISFDVPFGKELNRRFAIDYSYRVTQTFSGTHTFGARLSL